MAETDVLNADITWRKDLDDAVGPDFGWERLRASQLASTKPAGGSPVYRTIGNGGHTTTFSWLKRSQKCADYLKRWAEQFEDGYFTIIDQDGGGRHYVGTFVGDMPVTQAGNDTYNLQGWKFVETPGAPMLQYPNQWQTWAVWERPWRDGGALRTAFSGAWTRPAVVANADGSSQQDNSLVIAMPNAGDSITHEYRGYGFRLWANQGAVYGAATIYVDGVSFGGLNLADSNEDGPQVVFVKVDVPLGIHRVQVVLAASSATPPNPVPAGFGGMIYTGIEVMR